MYTNLELNNKQMSILSACLNDAICRLCRKQMSYKINGEEYDIDLKSMWDNCEKEINTLDEINKMINKDSDAKANHKSRVSKLYTDRNQIKKNIELMNFEYIHLYQADLLTEEEEKEYLKEKAELENKLDSIQAELYSW